MVGAGVGACTVAARVALVPAAILVVNGFTTRSVAVPAGRVVWMLNVEVELSLPVPSVAQVEPVSLCSWTEPDALGATDPVTVSAAGAMTGAAAIATA